jgi:AhpD family alkylhydroperoxidase
MVAVCFELPGQPFLLFHRSHSPIALRHGPDGRNPADVTKEMIMQARMTNPVFLVPEALKALNSLGTAIAKGGVPNTTLELVRLRASQINGCSLCVEMHARDLKKAGEKDDRLFTVAAWREAPYFTDAERAALALTEAATRMSDRGDAVSDEIWNEAAKHYDEKALADLVLNIALINFWNRVNVTIRQVSGAMPKAA